MHAIALPPLATPVSPRVLSRPSAASPEARAAAPPSAVAADPPAVDLASAVAVPRVADTESAVASPAAEADALAARAAAGDAAALAALVTRYHARALRFACNMGLAREDAEEAVQDAFVRVARALPRFRAGAPFEPWLFRILSNRCRSARVRTRAWGARRADAAALDLMPAPGRDALDRADVDDRRRRVLEALDTLPAEQREAFLLRHVEDLDYAAMARVTGAGESALKMRVKRACDALRARLGAGDAS